jgi:hypothetical protein
VNFLRRERWFLGFLGAMAGLLLLTWGWGTGRDSSWWAAWGQWVGGLGSIAAAWTAVWIALEGWRRSDRQAKEQARQLENLRSRELASKFGVWIEEQPVATEVAYGGPTGAFGMIEDVDKFVVMYNNTSGQPMYRVNVRVNLGIHGFPYAASRRYLPPTVEPAFLEEAPGSLETYIVEGIRQQRTSEDDDDAGLVEFARAMHADRAEIVVAFTDANGIRWYREEGGQLVRTDEEV